MFELASAVFSIADANEFSVRAVYIVCEAASETPWKSLVICDIGHTRKCQTWKEPHGIRSTNIQQEGNAHIFLRQMFHLHFS